MAFAWTIALSSSLRAEMDTETRVTRAIRTSCDLFERGDVRDIRTRFEIRGKGDHDPSWPHLPRPSLKLPKRTFLSQPAFESQTTAQNRSILQRPFFGLFENYVLGSCIRPSHVGERSRIEHFLQAVCDNRHSCHSDSLMSFYPIFIFEKLGHSAYSSQMYRIQMPTLFHPSPLPI